MEAILIQTRSLGKLYNVIDREQFLKEFWYFCFQLQPGNSEAAKMKTRKTLMEILNLEKVWSQFEKIWSQFMAPKYYCWICWILICLLDFIYLIALWYILILRGGPPSLAA